MCVLLVFSAVQHYDHDVADESAAVDVAVFSGEVVGVLACKVAAGLVVAAYYVEWFRTGKEFYAHVDEGFEWGF